MSPKEKQAPLKAAFLFVNTAYSQMRINNGYVKMTENESTYTRFYSKINKFFQNFASKRVY